MKGVTNPNNCNKCENKPSIIYRHDHIEGNEGEFIVKCCGTYIYRAEYLNDVIEKWNQYNVNKAAMSEKIIPNICILCGSKPPIKHNEGLNKREGGNFILSCCSGDSYGETANEAIRVWNKKNKPLNNEMCPRCGEKPTTERSFDGYYFVRCTGSNCRMRGPISKNQITAVKLWCQLTISSPPKPTKPTPADCPFCGAMATLNELSKFGGYYVDCTNLDDCLSSGPIRETADQAIRVWNAINLEGLYHDNK